MEEGVKLRAQLDTETVKGLLLINGGGAVASMALLPAILGKPELIDFAAAIVFSLAFFQLGLLSAVLHNYFRRKCSLAYESGGPKGCTMWGFRLADDYCICLRSRTAMWISMVMFFLAGASMFIGALLVIR